MSPDRVPAPPPNPPAYACVDCRISFDEAAQLIAHVKAVHAAALQRPRPATRRPNRRQR